MTLLDIDSLHLVESTVKNKGGYDGVRTWSTAVQILLPVAALAILWGKRGFFARFFLQFDKNCVSVFCPPFSKRQRLLKWASGRLPPTWSSHGNTFPGGPAAFWRDGSLLCTLINSAIPGACSNPHRHWKQPPSHGQALAYKYLGVAPVFTETELSQNGLSLRHEGALVNYLMLVQQAIAKISFNELKFSSRYAARGMGLVVGEQHRKAAFYIYSSSTTSSSKHDVMVSIRGPYNTHCTATIPTYYISGKYFRNHYEDKEFESKAQRSFLRSLSVDFGSFINVNQKPETDDMPIKLISENERVKVVFIPRTVGIHEISIITNGFHLVGSPFNVNIAENSSGVMDTFDESFRYPYRKNKNKGIRRKIISKIIDFIDEKISYENLKIQSIYERGIPKIKITQTKDVDKENCVVETAVKHAVISECITNTEEANPYVVNHLNAEEYISNVAKSSNFSKNDDELKLPATSHQDYHITTDNTLVVESNILNTFSNESIDGNVLSKHLHYDFNEIDRKESQANVMSAISNKSSNDDLNNNTSVLNMSTPLTRHPLDKSNIQSTFATSPICLEHIEEEVNDEPQASSEVPKWNFEKKPLRRQNNVDLSNISDNKEYGEELKKIGTPTKFLNNDLINGNLDDMIINDHNRSINSKSYEKIHESLKIPIKESQDYIFDSNKNQELPTTMKTYKFVVGKTNKNFEKQDYVNNTHDSKTNDQTKHNIESKLENSMFSEPNPLNILNFLSSLKNEDSNSEYNKSFPTIKQSTDYSTANQNEKNEFKHRNNFKQRLQYWESQTNLRLYNKKQVLRTRRSLPNLLSSAKRELFICSSENIDDQRYKHQNSEEVKFKSQFKERQAYWKTLSSHSINSSNISSSMYYLETLGKLHKHRLNARRSLPNLFSKEAKENILTEMSYRNLCFPIDFFDSPEAEEFRTKFRERREFWERLSTKNLNCKDSYEYIGGDFSEQNNIDDGNFDSGFYSSLPNLIAKIHTLEQSSEYSDSLKYKRQYEERREYWENLSLHSISDLSLNSLVNTTGNIRTDTSYSNKNAVVGSKLVLTNTFSEIEQEKEKVNKINEENTVSNLNCQKENTLGNDFQYSMRNREWTNLTDDFKRINDRREKMKKHFHQAKTFFQNLEDNIK